MTQLMRAVDEGDEQRVRELVAAGAPLDLVDIHGWLALYFALSHGHVCIAKLLLEGKYEGIPFVGTTGFEGMRSEEEGLMVSVMLDLPIKLDDRIINIIRVKSNTLKKRKST